MRPFCTEFPGINRGIYHRQIPSVQVRKGESMHGCGRGGTQMGKPRCGVWHPRLTWRAAFSRPEEVVEWRETHGSSDALRSA